MDAMIKNSMVTNRSQEGFDEFSDFRKSIKNKYAMRDSKSYQPDSDEQNSDEAISRLQFYKFIWGESSLMND